AEAGRPQAKPPARPALAWRVPVAGADRRPGAWGLGDVVVDGRIDGLYAYGARDGKARWNVSAPAREAVCAMSPRVGRNIGLIAYGRDGKPCATLLAVHTTTGEVLWREPVGGAGVGGVAVADTTTVAVEDRAVRGRSAESGEQRWQRALGRECEVRALDADGDRTLLVEQCGEGARLLALDTATGKERWNRALPVESAVRARVVSVTPAVIALDERDKRGSHALLGFDATGTPKATVPLTGADGTVTAFDDERPLVFGDLLVTRVERSSSVATSVVAYSLKDGRKVWQHRTDAGMFESLARQPDGTVAVLVRGRLQVLLLDPATGRVRGERTPRTEEQPLSIYPELIPVPGGHVVVNHITMNGEPGLFAIR
ncbi:PQQ-binding-like beta-propeller repeat protein, partial [Streptomyces showdoensis]